MIEPISRKFKVDLKKINDWIERELGSIDDKNVANKVAFMMGRDSSFIRRALRGQLKLPDRPFTFLVGAAHMMGVADFRELIVGMKQLECECPFCGRKIKEV